MKKFLLIITALFGFNQAFAQQPAALKSFDAEIQYNGNVLVTWTISAGYTCQDISLQYAPDSINFYTVYQSPGLNGSTGSDVNGQFLDASASASGPNYYRLDMGNCGLSRVITPSSQTYGTTGFYFDKMPVNSPTLLHFRNSGGYEFEFTLYDMKGRLRQVFLAGTNVITFDPGGLEQGIYYFNLISLTDFYKGKIVVVK